MSMRHLLLAAVFLAHPLVAGATHVVSPPVRPGPGDAVVCQLLNIGTSTIEHIDVQIRDFAGDPTGDSVFDGSIDDGGTFELKSTNPDAVFCQWDFPVGKKKTILTVSVVDSASHPRVTLQAD